MYHILIVDQEEHLLWALERNLFAGREDIKVQTALSGEEGLAILEREAIDLLISDIKMPGLVDGFEFILRAKEIAPDVRMMIITAFGTRRIQNVAERIGISHYVEKPFTVEELRAAVLEVLDEKEGFQGVLSELELTDIIQMLCLGKQTALLHLKHRDHRGRIVFDAGAVVHGEFDGITGVEAIYEMLDLKKGDIFMQTDYVPGERSIEMGWQDMLLEGVRRTDERRLEEAPKQTGQELFSDKVENEGTEQWEEKARTVAPLGIGVGELGLGGDHGAALLFSEEEFEAMSKANAAGAEEEVYSAVEGVADVKNSWVASTTSEEDAAVIRDEGEDESPGPQEGGGAESSSSVFDPPSRQISVGEVYSWIAEQSEAMDVESHRGDLPGERKRQSTSPGMTAIVNPGIFAEESGEVELVAAPAPNGRHSMDDEERAFTQREQSALEEFVRECPGLRATTLFSFVEGEVQESMTLTNLDDYDERGAAERMAEVFSGASRAVRALSRGDELLEVQLVLGQEYVLLRRIEGSSTIHLVLVDRQVSLGIALVLMRQLGRQLRADA